MLISNRLDIYRLILALSVIQESICLRYRGVLSLSINPKSISNHSIHHSQTDHHQRQNCSAISADFHPVILIQHGDQIHNESFDIHETSDISNEHRGYIFSISCSARYPVHWIINYFYNGERNAKPSGLHLHVYRKFERVDDPSTYVFLITSRMKYKNNHGFKNFSFTCSSTQQPECLQSTLYTSQLSDETTIPSTTAKGESVGNSLTTVSLATGLTSANKSGIRVNIIAPSSWGVESISEGKHNTLPDTSHPLDLPSPCDYTVYYRNVGRNNFALSCHFPDGSPGTVKVTYKCSNAISCSAFHRQNQTSFVERCVKPVVGGWNSSSSCKGCEERTLPLSQGFLSCISEESHHHHHHQVEEMKLLFFFASIPQEDESPGGFSSRLYFDMDHAEGEEMMSLGQLPPTVSLGDQINIVCNTSTYFFSGGTRLALKYTNSEELVFINSMSFPMQVEPSDASHSFGIVHERNLAITADTLERIYCFAPIWNSFAWVNRSQRITVQDNSSSHIVIAVSVTLFVTTIACAILFAIFWAKILRQRLSKFGKLLTPQEIEEFRRYQTTSNGTNGSHAEWRSLNPQQNDYECIQPGISNCCGSGSQSFVELKREQLLLDETAVLGKGHFGVVLKGVLKDVKPSGRVDVAVKTIKTKTDVHALKSLLSELKIMASVGKHQNVVNLVGACTKRMEKGEMFIAVEYCANGNMQIFLREHRDRFRNQLINDVIVVEALYSVRKSVTDDIICTLDLIKWSWEIAKGMEFLSSKKVIHGDLAARNILLTSDNIAKVSDFGLSRQLVDYYYVKEETGPMPWKHMGIESLRDMKFSIQSDVWSCGVTLWEIFSLGDPPYCGCNWSAEFVQSLVSGNRLGKPAYASSEMHELMRECWKEDPNERPSFSTIKGFFEDVLTRCSSQDYMQLDLRTINEASSESAATTPFLPMTPTIDISDYDDGEDEVFN